MAHIGYRNRASIAKRSPQGALCVALIHCYAGYNLLRESLLANGTLPGIAVRAVASLVSAQIPDRSGDINGALQRNGLKPQMVQCEQARHRLPRLAANGIISVKRVAVG